MKKLTAIQTLIEEYKRIRGYDKIVNWDKIHFSRHVRSAKLLLEQAGNYSEGIHALKTLCSYFERKNLDFTLETIVRRYPDLVACNLRDADDKAIYYNKLEPKNEQVKLNQNLEELRKLKQGLIKKIYKKIDDEEIEE